MNKVENKMNKNIDIGTVFINIDDYLLKVTRYESPSNSNLGEYFYIKIYDKDDKVVMTINVNNSKYLPLVINEFGRLYYI